MAQTKLIYGVHAVLAILEHQPETVLSLYCQTSADPARFDSLFSLAEKNHFTIQPISKDKLSKMVESDHHQGIAAKVKVQATGTEREVYDWLETLELSPLLLILEGIQDPHNLGACLRSAEGLGVDKIILSKNNTAPLNATVSKVACGADQRLSIVTVSNINRFITQIQKRGVWVVATTAEGERPLMNCNLSKPTAIVMGAEGKGLKSSTLEACDERVAIPLLGTVASLNVSVATGICLYECLRQRREHARISRSQ
jgi:23S rRNA (guanosine2251-2'-O)-methyltransferase